VAVGVDIVHAQFNNDTGAAKYGYQVLSAVATSVTGAEDVSEASTSLLPISGSSTVNTFGGGLVIIPHYANTANQKFTVSLSGANLDGSTTSGILFRFFCSVWEDNSAISEIDLFPELGTNFVAGTVFGLYGVGLA
jgi:hypothetical protein